MSEQALLGSLVLLMGLAVGIGMVLVRPAPGETERLRKIWPLAHIYRYKEVRLLAAAIGFAVAIFGLDLITNG